MPAERGVSSPSQEDSLARRAFSAALLAPPVLAACWLGGWAFTVLLVLAGAVMAYEGARLVFADGHWRIQFAVVAAAGAGALIALAAGAWPWALAFLVAGWGASLAAARHFSQELRWAALLLPYVALPLLGFALLRADPVLGLIAVVWLLAVVWACDTGAYFAGRAIGGPRLAPRLSPKKTWAGLAGGVIAAAVVGLGSGQLIDGAHGPALALLGAVLAALSQGGDIAISAVKRYFGVKDTGRLIPGHGGLLDRVDSLVAAACAGVLIGLVRAGPEGAAQGLLIW